MSVLTYRAYIPSYSLSKIKAEGDALQKNVHFLQKSVEVLGGVRGDWLDKYNEMIISVGQLQEANKDLAQLVSDKTEKLEAILKIYSECNCLTTEDYGKAKELLGE